MVYGQLPNCVLLNIYGQVMHFDRVYHDETTNNKRRLLIRNFHYIISCLEYRTYSATIIIRL